MTRLLPVFFGLLLASALPRPGMAQSGGAPGRVDNVGTAAATLGARAPQEAQLDIMMSYYAQDGKYGAVQGGTGTQRLTDLTPTILLNVPLDSVSRLTANLGLDNYSSASTDRIDFALSTPSASDTRYHADFGYSRELPAHRSIVGLGAGFSREYDYTSLNVSGSWAQTSRDGNRQLSVTGQAFFDQAKIIYPIELRDQQWVTDNKRRSYNLGLVWSQVLTQRLQVALSTELVYQHGLLSTPFHRVYFRETGTAKGAARVEKLPGSRFKYPVGLRLSYYATDLLLLRSFLRYYRDDFGVQAQTVELETPLKLTPYLVLYPFYRFHHQTAARYFAPYLQHSIQDEFYTSDYDLAGFNAHKAGLGLRYSPLYGLGRFKTPFRGRVAMFKAVELRYAYYRQTTGLVANLISTDFSFTMP